MVWPISITKFKKLIKRAALAGPFYILINISSALSQESEKPLNFYPTAGITWRSTAMNFFNLKGIWPADPTIPYSYERNVQGLALNIGLQARMKYVGFEYYPGLRYDAVHGTIGVENKYVKEFLIDHNFNFFVGRKITYGIGISIVNDNKVYSFVNPILRYHNIEFKTYNFFVTVPIKKVINLEIKALYVPTGFPYNPKEKYIMYSLRVYYKFNFLNSNTK